MGLLNRFAFGQMPGYDYGLFPQPEPQQQMPMDWSGFRDVNGAPAYAPSAPRQSASAPQMPAERNHTIQPLASSPINAMPQMQYQSPTRSASPMNISADDVARRPTLSERVQSGFDSPLFGYGMALLAGAEPNGGGWAGAAQGFQNVNQQYRQRQQQDRQNRREDSAWARQQTAWGQEDQQRRDWEAALNNERDPVRQATLRALGPAGYGEWMSGEQQRAFAAQQQQNQQTFQAHEGQLDRSAAERAAAIRAANENPLGRMFQSMDAQQLGAMNQRSSVLQAQTLPALRQVRENILQAGRAATGQPVDYNSRIVINRVFNGQGADRQALETWRARILRPALEMLPPGPATDRDVALVMENFANPNMQIGSALSLIDERIAAAEREVIQSQAANDFFGSANGLTGARNSQGQDWPTFLASRMQSAPGIATQPGNGIPVGGYPEPPRNDIEMLRRNSSAERRAFFDQTYGPGAAQRALAQQRSPIDMGRDEEIDSYRERLRRQANAPLAPRAAREAARRELQRIGEQ